MVSLIKHGGGVFDWNAIDIYNFTQKPNVIDVNPIVDQI